MRNYPPTPDPKGSPARLLSRVGGCFSPKYGTSGRTNIQKRHINSLIIKETALCQVPQPFSERCFLEGPNMGRKDRGDAKTCHAPYLEHRTSAHTFAVMTNLLDLKRQRALLDIMICSAENDVVLQSQEQAFKLFDGLPRGVRLPLVEIRQAGRTMGVQWSAKRWRIMLNRWAAINKVSIRECKKKTNRAVYLT